MGAGPIQEHNHTIRVLFMSGYADEAVSRNGTLEPGAAFLEKPFSANDLAKKVRGTLDQNNPTTDAPALASTRARPG